jgi:hypothetical protein
MEQRSEVDASSFGRLLVNPVELEALDQAF